MKKYKAKKIENDFVITLENEARSAFKRGYQKGYRAGVTKWKKDFVKTGRIKIYANKDQTIFYERT